MLNAKERDPIVRIYCLFIDQNHNYLKSENKNLFGKNSSNTFVYRYRKIMFSCILSLISGRKYHIEKEENQT